jgi:hypothetical protein
MIIKVSEMKRALEIVKPGLANKEIIEQTTSFAFMNGRVVTYNDEISISHPVKGLEFEGAILADEFYKFLTKVKTEDIDIDLVTNEQIVMKSGRSKVGLTIQTEITLPIDEELKHGKKWTSIPDNFMEGLQFACQSCSSDMTNPKLTCVHINEAGFIEGTDNYRICKYTLDKELPIETTLIPATAIIVVIKINPTKMAQGKGWFHFKTKEGTIISCRTFKEEYVNLAPFLKNKKTGTVITFPDTIFEVLDKAQVFAQRKSSIDESISIFVKSKVLTVKSESATGWFEEKVPFKYLGDEFNFNITPYLLKDILKQNKKCYISKNELRFQGENWIYLTALRGAE